MERILAFMTGLGLAGIGAFFMLRSHKYSSAAALEKALNDAAKQAQADKEKDIATLTADLKNAKENLAQCKIEAEAHEKKLLAAKEEAHQADMLEMQRHHQTALETLEQRFKDAIKADKDRLDTALEALKADVKNTTTEALKQRQNEFQQTNSSSMKQIVEPLKETLQKMETALKENKSVHETSTATIKENIATLVSKAMQVSHSAERLSNALTAENKTQGCWGEQKIEALLDAMGLEKGLQYDSQEFLRDASGNVVISDETARRMQPDIILHLDATRDLIIDSKVSLRAFVEYTNAANDEERSVALAAHIKSVRNHVKELAKKNYAAYVKHPRQSVDFVMMFVPIDSALQLALLNAPSLWREAMNQGVFIVGEQNLYAALRAVDVTWTTIKQDANNKAICEAGAELMDRVGLLLKRVTALGKCLESATNAYLDVKDKSINGQKGVLCAAKKLEKLGAKPSTKHPLPSPEIDDDATLSLPMRQ